MLETKIDKIISFLKSKKNREATFKEISEALNISEKDLEKFANSLKKKNFISIFYSLNFLSSPKIKLEKTADKIEEQKYDGKKILSYELKSKDGNIPLNVEIIEENKTKYKRYILTVASVSEYTKAYFDDIKERITVNVPLTSFSEKEQLKEIKNKFIKEAKPYFDILEKDTEKRNTLLSFFLNEMFGLGKLEYLLADPNLEEIAINNSKVPVLVYHRKYGWLISNIYLESEEEIANYSSYIARQIDKQITTLNPMLDAHLSSGDRVNATLYPISSLGNTITIRKFSENPLTIVNFISDEFKTLSLEMASLLWQAVQYELNILVIGGTGSGKTSMLNVLSLFVPPNQRIISIEETREIYLPPIFLNWIPLLTRPPNLEGLGEVKMLDLMINSLRMRPDRIFVGEIRRSEEAQVLFEAMHTGHSVYSTMHADTASQALRRLTEPPFSLSPTDFENLNLIVTQYRDRRKNIRRTLEIAEIQVISNESQISKIFQWRARSDHFEFVKLPAKYIQTLNLYTGLSEKEIYEDQKNKQKVLDWLLKNNIYNIKDVSKCFSLYYKDENELLKLVETKAAPSKVLA